MDGLRNFKYAIGWKKIVRTLLFLIFFFCPVFSPSVSAAYLGEYWNVPIGPAPAFPTRAADYARSDAAINFNWGEGSPAPGTINVDGFVVRWTETVNLAAGRYLFTTYTDDGVRVYVDNSIVINQWVDQSPKTWSGYIDITAGTHTVKVEYYENGGGAVAQASYQNLSPVVQSYSPADNAINVGRNDNLVLTFDKNIFSSSGSENDIVIYDGNDQIFETINSQDAGKVSISGNAVTVNPQNTFEDMTAYYVRIASGVFYASAGYPGISDETTWNFTTGDFAVPDTSDDYGAKDGVWQNTDQTVAVSPSDPSPSSGIAWTKYCLDDGSAACDPAAGNALASPYRVTITQEGTTYLRYASQDNSGNVQDAVSREIKIDKSAPIISAGSDRMSDIPFIQTAVVSDSASGIDSSTYVWAKVSGPGNVIFGNISSLGTFIDADKVGTYVISFTAADNVGNSGFDSFIFTKTGTGALPPAAFWGPKPPADGFGIKINGGASAVSDRNVLLEFAAGTDVKKMAISRSGDFTDAGVEDFQRERTWDLCGENGGAVCAGGEYFVYVKFYTAWGKSSQPISASINLRLGEAGLGNAADHSRQEAGAVDPDARFVFIRDLRLGMRGEDVMHLQMLLNQRGFSVALSGAGSPGNETEYFGPATRQAVIRLQKAYGLKPYPGNIGPATRKLLNSL